MQQLLAPLTPRELECALLSAEYSTQEIGERLGIAPATAKTHIDRARLKLQVKSKRQLPQALRAAGLEA